VPNDVLSATAPPRASGPISAPLAAAGLRRPSTPTEVALTLAFAPLHKRAFGTGVGAALALFFVLLTSAAMLRDPAERFPITLLAQYFYGFERTWAGVAIAGFWGAVVGYVMGWFAAFCRNLWLAVWLLYVRARADFAATRDMLDHI
jgi:hypothetical protein